ncbi:MAG: tRNA (guanosine(37)-N1)-methyltransferase TrmD [Dermatophilaceae bacterium]
MRIDVVTIFPDYLAPLDLSLIGAARRDGLLDVRVTDLREFTHDRHRTVDDTPYGGGAGMVMKPEPWGEALGALLDAADRSAGPATTPVLVVPGPAGERFTHAVARQLAGEEWLLFACGRYEGIDERVRDYARELLGAERVRELSLGDYVLNGGEAAVLAMVEAIARLVPGVIGNDASLVEESHRDGLLEYPVFTKPARWRGYDVPPVLLSGDHAAIALWRREESWRRTAARRPDLLPAEQARAGADSFALTVAVPADAGELWTLTRACFRSEVLDKADHTVWPAVQTLDQLRETLAPGSPWRTWVLREPTSGRLVGSVRGRLVDAAWEIGQLVVAPDLQSRGLGSALLAHAVAQAGRGARHAWLVTEAKSVQQHRAYKRAGFRVRRDVPASPDTIVMQRPLLP